MIQLLDGKTFEEKDILEKMKEDSFYYGYLGKTALSSSSIKLLLVSPKKYKYVTEYGSKTSQGLRDGWLFHTAILEPDVFTMKEKEDAERLADAFLRNEYALQMITDCEFEVPAISTISGYPFRAKADVLDSYRIVDLKTTADLKAFPYAARKYGYDVQVYIYSELFNKSYKEFKFIAIDKGSLDIGIYDVSEDFYNSGRDKVTKALETFKTFFIDGADIDSYCIKSIL